MSKLKFLMFILLSIIFGSCNDINDTDTCNVCNGFLERINAPAGIQAIAVASNGDIWIATTNIENHTSFVYLSTNNGDTWDLKASFSYPYSLSSLIEISPINGYIFIASNEGLFRSTDRGTTWVKIESVRYINIIHDILIKPSGEIYFTMEGFMYYSSDNGDTWIDKSNGLPGVKFALALGKDGTLYAGTGSFGVYRSTDDGDTWLPPSNYDGASIHKLTISNDGSIFSASGYRGIFKSTDKGVTWTQINGELSAYGIIYNPITEDIFVSDDDGIHRSTDIGITWTKILPNTINVFAFNPNTGQMYLGGNGGFYRFTK